MLQLHGWGGADMLNLFDPSGRKLTSVEQRRRPIAPRSQKSARVMGATKVIHGIVRAMTSRFNATATLSGDGPYQPRSPETSHLRRRPMTEYVVVFR